VIDSSDPNQFPRELIRLGPERHEVTEFAGRARAYAEEYFTQAGFAARSEQTLEAVVRAHATTSRRMPRIGARRRKTA
jgi:hypothetical protein